MVNPMKRRLLTLCLLFSAILLCFSQTTNADSRTMPVDGRTASADSQSVAVGNSPTVAETAKTPKYSIPKRFYRNIAFGGHRRQSDSLRVAKLNIGLWNYVDSMSGFQLGLFKSGAGRSMRGLSIGGILNGNFGNSSGVQIAGVANLVVKRMRGLQIGTINFAGKQDGVQIGVLSNITSQPLEGVQLGIISNVSRGIDGGVQAGLLNINAGVQRGFQFGEYNFTDTLHGFQLGLINVADRVTKGYQIGIVNMTNERDSRHLGLININPRTRIQFMASVGNYDKLTTAVRFRNRSTYYILGIGSFHSGLGTSRYSGSIGYRIGQYLNISPKLSISGDIGYSHIETFREKASERPERLYSLQWRINADWQLNRYLGAYISTGYGQTRWYNHHRKFRDKPIIEAGLTVDLRPFKSDNYLTRTQRVMKYAEHFDSEFGPYAESARDSIFAYNLPYYKQKHPWWAASEVVGINLFVHYFDRFVLNADYAKTNPSSLARNFRKGFVWDNDQFSTNQFAHPYHGNLYFNTARTNGLNYWQSIPYTLGGSLMWELWGETDPPAINDVISTTCGGMALGEVLFRTSAFALDDSKVGWPRFWHELAAGILNPVRAFNRIIHGDAWRVRTNHNLYHDFNRIPVDASFIIGGRYVADESHFARGSHNLRLGFHLEYGDAFADEPTKPYDYFSADFGFEIGSQPFLSDIHIIGRLYGHDLYEGQNIRAQWGIFQHFDYYASDSIKGSDMKNPFEISETAAFGPGIILQIPATGSLSLLEQRMFLNGILLGGSKSDYYHFIDRDYNIGRGFGWKSNTRMIFRKFGSFALNVEYYRLWTWKGFEKKDYEAPDFDPRYLNAQGDKSNAQLFVFAPMAEIRIGGGWNLILRGAFYNRITHYHYHDSMRSHTYEFTIGGSFHF